MNTSTRSGRGDYMLSKCNVFKEGLEDSYKKIFVSKKDRMQLDTSSKGSQIRWYKDNIFIKLDCLGYEGISEELVSKLLDYSNVEHVQYEVCEIYEDNKFIGNGCYSFNFLNEDEQVFTFASILKKYSRDYATFNYDEVFEAMYDATGFDVRIYLDHCICIDAIVKNEDRHFNNLAIIRYSNGKFS